MTSNDGELESDVEEQARFLTTCSICLDQFKIPKVLPCQHTFCLSCLKSFYESINKTRLVAVSNFPCPTCRKTCYVPPHGIHKLSDDFRIGQISDLLTAIECSQQKTKVNSLTFGHCSICRYQKREKPARVFCLQCEKAFCNECLSHHSKAKIFQHHVIINDENKNEEAEGEGEINLQNNKIGKCFEHNNEFKYLCEDCSVLLCTVCLFSEHSSHSIKEKSQVLVVIARKLEGLVEEINTKLNTNNSMTDSLKSLKEQQTKSYTSCEMDIKTASKKAIQEIENLQTQMLSNIKVNYDQASSELDNIYVSLEKDSNDLSETRNNLELIKSAKESRDIVKDIYKIEKLIKNHQATNFKPFVQEIYKFKISINIILGNMEKAKKTINLHMLCAKKDTDADCTLKSIQNSTSSLKASSSKSSLISSSSSCIPNISSSSMNKENRDKPKNQIFSFPAPRKFTKTHLALQYGSNPNAQGDVLFGKKMPANSSDKVIQGLGRRLSCKLTNHQLSTPTVAPKLNWVDTSFNQCRDCCFLQLNGVWMLAACDSKATSPMDRIKLFDLKGNRQQVVTARQVLEPWGMLFQQSNNSFVVTDPISRSIKMVRLDETGKCSRVFTMCQSYTDKPTGISMTRSGSYVVTDTGGRVNRLAIYEATSNFVEKKTEFGKKGPNDSEVALSNFVAVDHNDRIIVSDSEGKQVKVFSLDGKQLLKFSCSCSFDGSKEMEPQGVAVDDCNNILVADQAMKGVGMFNSEGVLIGHVASTKGLPWGVSYLDHRRILAVATNHGLEVFEL